MKKAVLLLSGFLFVVFFVHFLFPDCAVLAAANGRFEESDLTYRGAFRLPGASGGTDWTWDAGNGLTHYPEGNPAGTDSYTGSLFGTSNNTVAYVAEISIPQPVNSSTLTDLNIAATLQGFIDVKAGLFAELEIITAGLQYFNGRLHFCFGQHFQDFAVSHGSCSTDLSDLQIQGAWHLGTYTDYVINDYMFQIPAVWADANVSGQYLATGRFREGEWGGRGPALFAYNPGSSPPDAGGTITALTPLLLYGVQESGVPEISTGDSMQMNNYKTPDQWTGAAWLSAGDNSAVIFVGTKAIGNAWYGYSDGTLWEGEGTVVPPWPHNDRGYWADSIQPQIIFFDPDDLASVANGAMETYAPQPYETMDLSAYFYETAYDYERAKRILTGGAAYDRTNGYIYIVELRIEDDEEKSIVHVFQVEASDDDDDEDTGEGPFDEWVLIQNPNSVSAEVTVTFMRSSGSTNQQAITIAPTSRHTIHVDDLISNDDISTQVVSSQPVIAERTMYWNPGGRAWAGGHNSVGVTAAAASWYFAEGYTGSDFDEYICIQNPNSATATVNVTFMPPGGTTQMTTMTVAPTARSTLNVENYISGEVSVAVSADIGVIAERAMYWNRGGIDWIGGHCSIGITAASTSWYFAEGFTSDTFDQYICLQNANDSAAEVTITFMRPDSTVVTTSRTIGANSRETINVENYVVGEVSTAVTADVGIIAERAMYWNAGGIEWIGGHCACGVTTPSTSWYLAEGCTSGDFSEYICIQNPNDETASVTVSFMTSDGSVTQTLRSISGNSRETVNVGNYVTGDVSAQVTSDVTIVVERAMYWDSNDVIWSGGHCSAGVTAPATSWYLAEGHT